MDEKKLSALAQMLTSARTTHDVIEAMHEHQMFLCDLFGIGAQEPVAIETVSWYDDCLREMAETGRLDIPLINRGAELIEKFAEYKDEYIRNRRKKS